MTRKEGINPLFDYSSNNNNNNSNSSGIETYRFDAARNLSLPNVTVRRRKQPTQRPCGRVAFGMKLLIGLIPIYFYRQIMDVSLSTDMFSSPVIRHDYSDVRSIHDLSAAKVEQWCQRNVYDCKCKDPMIGFPRESETSWQKAHGANVELAKAHGANVELAAASTTTNIPATATTAATTLINPDVVFFGDGLIERWQHHKAVFNSFFSTNSGGKFDGMAMGISGDRSPNLLWRIQNGELPETLQPSVFWVAIGTQDLGLTFCSPELVIIGVLRVVEEILLRTRSSEVVINAILPRTFNKEGYVAKGGSVKPSLWEDIKVINNELKLYATYRSRVSFFDSTNTYLEDPKATTAELKIDENLMDDFFHLTKKGYQKWASEASEKLQEMSVLPYRNSTQQKNQEEDKQEFFRDDDW